MLGYQRRQSREAVDAVALDGVGLDHEDVVDQPGGDADAGVRPLFEVALDLPPRSRVMPQGWPLRWADMWDFLVPNGTANTAHR